MQRKQDKQKQKQSLEALTGKPRQLISRLQWKHKLLEKIPMQAHVEMTNPLIREFITEQLSPGLVEFITNKFPEPDDCNRVLFGAVLLRDART